MDTETMDIEKQIFALKEMRDALRHSRLAADYTCSGSI